MKINNLFFRKIKKVKLSKIFNVLNIKKINNLDEIFDIKDLNNASSKDISFFNSLKYLDFLKKTKAKYILVEKKYEKIVKNYSNPVVIPNVLKSVAIITELFTRALSMM